MRRTTNAPPQSPTLSPNDHVRLLVELLRPATPELARRWLAALLMAPAEERLAIVVSVEKRMTELYGRPDDDTLLHIPSDTRQYPTHSETVIRSYSASGKPKATRKRASP